jgi:electron transfer flavoprotein alpha subunit
MRSSLRLLGKSLVLAEACGGKVVAATLSAITAAGKLGPVTALVAGKDAKALAEQLAAVKGVDEVLFATGDHYSSGLPEELSPLVQSVVKANGFTHVVAATSAFGKNIIPRAAAQSDSMPLSEVVGIVDEATFVRATYAGNAITTVKSADGVKFATVRATAFEKAPAGGSAKLTEVPSTPAVNISSWIKDTVAVSDKPALDAASVVIGGGRGLKNAENFKLLNDLAAPLKAAVGCTRAVVDAGWCPNDMQIGQTGKTIAPTLYMGFGISGAIQHVAGMKDSKVIVAVNTDADAPLFQLADYGLVGDLFDAVPKLTAMVGKK